MKSVFLHSKENHEHFVKNFNLFFRHTKKWVSLKEYLDHKARPKVRDRVHHKNQNCIIHVIYQQNKMKMKKKLKKKVKKKVKM